MNYTKSDIIFSLRESGIKPNDSVFFTTSLGMVGVPPEEIDTNIKLNKLFLEAIEEVLIDGNILVPTYSYTFGASTASEPAIFDLKNTRAEIGLFPNFVLSQNGFIRSKDPFTSVACKGNDCEHFFSKLSNTSYGKGSFFSKMVKINNMKCCSIGLGPNWTPFIHYADWLEKVPHRYDKKFHGYIKDKGKLKYSEWIYSVAFLGPQSQSTAHKVGRKAEELGIWKSSKLGRARVYTAKCNEFFNFVMSQLKKDKWTLAVGPQVEVESEEKIRMNDTGDNNIDFSGYKITEYKTGEWIGGWLVPERWICHEARLTDLNGNVLSTKAYLYSLSVNKNVDVETLKKHVSKKEKNVYNNRDWGFVYDGELSQDEYNVVIKSDFGFGTIKVLKKDNKNYAFLAKKLVRIDKEI